MPDKEKRYLKGTCQSKDGCSKKAIHLRGYIEHYVMGDFLKLKAFCGEHTRKWDKDKVTWNQDLPKDDPRHMFPSSLLQADDEKAERMAAEQEAYERALRQRKPRPARPTWEAVQARRQKQPKVVRLN